MLLLQNLNITLLFFFFSPVVINSQNLIPNHSFENYIDFSTSNSDEWHRVQNNDTPDYFNLSNITPSNNIFDKYMGGAQALKVGLKWISIVNFTLSGLTGLHYLMELRVSLILLRACT
jgi:hypothetical protein